ncbi:hypothetical protein BGZ60DRAFT_431294 [Tricladium varicosporioides]|nr:hypothetical protein BGZ60DRAFT_431294 [Hymenoscyphus varicosporioides]
MGTASITEVETPQRVSTSVMKIREHPKNSQQTSYRVARPPLEHNHPRPNLPHTLSKSPPTPPKDQISTQPFCCASAIPITVKHLLTIVPPRPIRQLHQDPVSLASLLVNFFAFAESCKEYIKLGEEEKKELSPFIEFCVILQVTVVLGASTPSGLLVSPSSCPSTSPSHLTTGLPLRQSSLSPRSPQVSSLFTPNSPPHASQTRHYWVPVQGSVGKWRQISKHEAEDCIRPLGSGIMVGDGEDWKGLGEKEELWCPSHRIWWGVEGWVRES